MSMKNSSDTIGNQTRGFPACSAVRMFEVGIEFLSTFALTLGFKV
jgi:hypothetical protein